MPRVLVLFLDGVGLGDRDADRNPFAAASLPTIETLLGGHRMIASSAPIETDTATLLSLDACLGQPGAPQSATGQAALLTGLNVAAMIGQHYGPKPTPQIRGILEDGNLFSQILQRGGTAAFLNAYPPRYFESIRNGRRIHAAIPFAAETSGVRLRTAEDLQAGQALSADLTGEGWVAQPGFPPAPVYTPVEAGKRLAFLSSAYDLAWFDYWLTDLAGHRGSMAQAVALLQTFDLALGALIEEWKDRQDLIVLTSDHGNLEDLSKRGHTQNPVPALLIGPSNLRRPFAKNLTDLTGFAPSILRTLFETQIQYLDGE
ncbi:MAG: hypothetical protein PVJ32_01100 [Anaerolineales bacterium]|jgi:hypothetical protein